MRLKPGLELHRCVDCAYWEPALNYFGEPTGEGGCRFTLARNRKGDRLRECDKYQEVKKMEVEVKHPKEIRRNGYIATLRRARRGHKCSCCGFPIEPSEEYYEVVKGGGGLGWLKFPDRCHIDCFNQHLERGR